MAGRKETFKRLASCIISAFKPEVSFMYKILVYIILICSYLYFLSARRDWANDDVVIGAVWYCVAADVVRSLWVVHCENVGYYVYKVFRNVWLYGWLRVLLYGLSLFLVAYCFVYALDQAALFSWKTAGAELVKRLEDNIVNIKEDRNITEDVVIHPSTKGLYHPTHLHRLPRYQMEDVQMTCFSVEVLWFSGKPLAYDHVTWQLNGKPLEFTDRHSLFLEATELPFISPRYRQGLKDFGISMYEVRAILYVNLLGESDFGSYTCHMKDVKKEINQYISFRENMKQASERRARQSKEQNSQDKDEKGENECACPPRRKPVFPQCDQAPIPRYLPQDTITWKEEYRVIELRGKQEKFRMPPASILSLLTTYVSLTEKGEIEAEYLVNNDSWYGLCPDLFHGCSIILLLYYLLTGHELGGVYVAPPPFQLVYVYWFQHVLCLCENSYGIHSVQYLRRYFNRTTAQYELIEITHPFTLAVIPRNPTMLDISFVNRSMFNSDVFEKESSPEYINYFKPIIEILQIRKELAVALVKHFRATEFLLLLISLVFVTVLFYLMIKFLGRIGTFIRRCTLQGFLGYYITAIFSNRQTRKENDTSYDIFLSHCDADRDSGIARQVVLPFLEERGYIVCLPDRDLPPNALELPALDDAIERSKHFVIFLSEDYVKERFQEDFEANIIAESIMSRPADRNQVLVVKLDSCNVPLSLRHFPVYNWTTNLAIEDHFLKLVRWLEPNECASSLRGPLDIIITFLPMELAAVFWLIHGYWTAANHLREITAGDPSEHIC